MFFIDVQYYYFDFIIYLDNFGWVDVFVGLIYFGDVYQVFDVWFDFNECIVIGDVGDFVEDVVVGWVMMVDVVLWIFVQLFQVQ